MSLSKEMRMKHATVWYRFVSLYVIDGWYIAEHVDSIRIRQPSALSGAVVKPTPHNRLSGAIVVHSWCWHPPDVHLCVLEIVPVMTMMLWAHLKKNPWAALRKQWLDALTSAHYTFSLSSTANELSIIIEPHIYIIANNELDRKSRKRWVIARSTTLL